MSLRARASAREHVHAPDPEHGAVEVKAVERVAVKMSLERFVAKDFAVVHTSEQRSRRPHHRPTRRLALTER
jgi:hypothetical protein